MSPDVFVSIKARLLSGGVTNRQLRGDCLCLVGEVHRLRNEVEWLRYQIDRLQRGKDVGP